MADDLKTIAQQLLRQTTPEEHTLAALVDGLKAAFRRLQAKLAPIVGSMGVRSIMTLCIRRAAERHPFLAEISVYEDGIDAEEVLRQKSDRDYGEVREAFADLLTGFLKLLAQLLGNDLALVFVREAIAEEEIRGTE